MMVQTLESHLSRLGVSTSCCSNVELYSIGLESFDETALENCNWFDHIGTINIPDCVYQNLHRMKSIVRTTYSTTLHSSQWDRFQACHAMWDRLPVCQVFSIQIVSLKADTKVKSNLLVAFALWKCASRATRVLLI
jgi:hypothetical protein